MKCMRTWAQVPTSWEMPAAAVTVDAQDRVYCFNRTKDHPVMVFDRDGNYLSSWGAGVFAFPHAIRADKNNNLWLVDRDHGQMMLFQYQRGTPPHHWHQRPAFGHWRAAGRYELRCLPKVTHGGGPFNLPTDIDLTSSGEMFITDGYGNARVHKFAADGTYLFSWGEPGTAPGQFNLPHGVWIDKYGRVLVADRERPRPGLDQMANCRGLVHDAGWPGPFYMDADDIVYLRSTMVAW